MFGKIGSDLTFVGSLLVLVAIAITFCGPGLVGASFFSDPGPGRAPHPGTVIVVLAHLVSLAVGIAVIVVGELGLRRIGLRMQKEKPTIVEPPSKFGLGFVIPLVLLGAVAVFGVVTLMSGTSWKEKYAKIQVGMSRDEVVKILGHFFIAHQVPEFEFQVGKGLPSPRRSNVSTAVWKSEFWEAKGARSSKGWRITVVFENDKVVRKEQEGL
jgi:hypothetical protein